MKYRRLGKTGFNVSEVSLGTWQVGGQWGTGFDDALAEEILNAAIDRGVNFIDTADVYEDRQSEAAVARVVKSRSERVYVASKCGRFISPHVSEGYTTAALRGYVEESLRNTGFEALDLIQLHCPPTEVFYRPELFGLFEELKREGKVLNLGVSVEKVEEALKAIEYPNVTTVQIIFNLFRQRPAERFLDDATRADVGVIARVPLASGLLTGRLSRETQFGPHDHRHFNRDGAAFDQGETFAGVPYEIGLDAVEQLRSVFTGVVNLSPKALRWVLDHDSVSTVIPGASRVEQLITNLEAAELPRLDEAVRDRINENYERLVKKHVHYRW